MYISPLLSLKTFIKSILIKHEPKYNNFYKLSYARGSIIIAIFSIIFSKKNIKKKIYLPAYICDTVVYLLEEYQIDYKFYKINENLTPDIYDIKQMDTSNSIFLLVNFFGFNMMTNDLKKLLIKNNMALIQDYAHSIFIDIEKNISSIYGDAFVFGLRKIFPLENGALLYLNNINYFEPKIIYKNQGLIRNKYKMILLSIMNQFLNIKFDKKIFDKNDLVKHPKNYYYFNYFYKISSMSKKILNSLNVKNIFEKRRNNYQYLYNYLSKNPYVYIPETLKLTNNFTVPWELNFYYKNSQKLISYLLKNNISVSYFPELHPSVLNNNIFTLENKLLQKSINLPVHQDIKFKDIKKIIYFIDKYFFENYGKL